MRKEDLEDILHDNPEIITYDGFDDAIIGTAERINLGPVIAYDVDKIIEILMEDGMTHEGALEYYHFNIIGGWSGDFTPVFIQK